MRLENCCEIIDSIYQIENITKVINNCDQGKRDVQN